jgi:hypothetical protein
MVRSGQIKNRIKDMVKHLSFLVRSQNYEEPLLASSYLSVRQSAWNNSAPIGRIFIKFYVWVLFQNVLRKLKFH